MSSKIKCPACGSQRVFHSRAKSRRDRFLKRAFPITFYRCHDCIWRRSRFTRDWKALGRYMLSLIGYTATLGVALGIMAALLAFVLILFGVPMPWSSR